MSWISTNSIWLSSVTKSLQKYLVYHKKYWLLTRLVSQYFIWIYIHQSEVYTSICHLIHIYMYMHTYFYIQLYTYKYINTYIFAENAWENSIKPKLASSCEGINAHWMVCCQSAGLVSWWLLCLCVCDVVVVMPGLLLSVVCQFLLFNLTFASLLVQITLAIYVCM